MTASLRIAAELTRVLRDAGGDLLFGVPGGGSNLDVVGAAEAVGMRFVLAHGETAATIMAGVAAELTGCPSAAVVTRGPGAASAVNGCAQALLDRQPIVLITDCVTAADRERVSHQRLDQQQLFSAAAKRSVVLAASETEAAAKAIVDLALAGRPGPVHVDVDPTAPAQPLPAQEPAVDEGRSSALDEARRLLGAAQQPVAVVGVGAVAVVASRRGATLRAVRRFVEDAGMPTLSTYKGRGVVADGSAVAAGVASGAIIEASLLHDADLVVGIGLDPVELIPAPWPYDAPVVLVNGWEIDDSSFFGDWLRCQVVGDVASSLDELHGLASFGGGPAAAARHRDAERRRVEGARPGLPAGVVPQDVVTVAREASPPGTVATVDAGAHMFPAMHLWTVGGPGEVLISSGLATMGFSLPAAVAAALVRPDRHVVCFTGDGGLGMALAELETLARLALPVVVVVFNDSLLSLIAAKQRPDGHGGDRAVRYARTDFAAIAAGCGLAAARSEDIESYRRAITNALGRQEPTLLDVTVDPAGYSALLGAIRGGPRPASE